MYCSLSFPTNIRRGTFSFEEVLYEGSRFENKERLTEISKLVQFDDIYNIQFTSVRIPIDNGSASMSYAAYAILNQT